MQWNNDSAEVTDYNVDEFPTTPPSSSLSIMFLISYLAGVVQYLSTTPVHPVLFPFPWASTLHAARITHAFRGRIKAMGTQSQISRGPEYTGFLLMVRLVLYPISVLTPVYSVGVEGCSPIS